ncbi:hypothetical protein D9M69_551510 [compost metagenome]
MRTKFWRFAYEDSELAATLKSDELPFPELSKWPSAKNSSCEQIIEDLKFGDFILLANFDRLSEIGIVKAIGQVAAKKDTKIIMYWKKLIPSLSLTPDIRGGVNVWSTEGVFCFDEQPAKRYKLHAHTKKLFGNSA